MTASPFRGNPGTDAASALRYYEARGLIASEARAGSGQRHFARAVLRRIAFIVFAQRVGLSLDEIGVALATLPDGRMPTARDWSRLSAPWRDRIDRRIAELMRLRDSLSRCIGCGCLSLDHCRLVNPGDRASAGGPGLASGPVKRGNDGHFVRGPEWFGAGHA